MRSEKEKMLRGELYDPADAELQTARNRARKLCKQFNDSAIEDIELRTKLLKELIPQQGENLWIEPPFYCDYGTNIQLGNKVYFNYNCVILDVCKVTIGNNCMLAPGVQIYAATHPLSAVERNSGLELGKPVTIGNDVWIGGNVTIVPGVTIGDRCVIGAGSVVVKDIPADSVAAGSPAHVIKTLAG